MTPTSVRRLLVTAALVAVITLASSSVYAAARQGKVLAGTSVTVSNNAELIAALKTMSGGGTVFLRPGNYGALNLYGPRETFARYVNEVIIASVEPASPAVFNEVTLTQVSNITFKNIKFDYVFKAGDPHFITPFEITNSTSTRIYNSEFDGDIASGVSESADGYGYGNGLTIRGGANHLIEGSKFHKWLRATVVSTDGFTLRNNEFYDLRSDGTDLAEVTDVLIEGNYYHDFKKSVTSADHLDMIQLWSTGVDKPSKNIIIRKNILDSNAGSETQSIFMRNELVDQGLKGTDFFYQNILIEDNIIHNAHSHGITVGETNGLIIRRNTILQNKSSAESEAFIWMPTINPNAKSTNVIVSDNIVSRLDLKPTASQTFTNNLVVQRNNPYQSDYYGTLFADALADAKKGPTDLRAIVGGEIERLGVGSVLTRFDTTPTTTDGYITSVPKTGLNRYTYTFDATNVYGPSGKLAVSSVSWNFGDGKSGTGATVSHTYERAGTYQVTADVTTSNGEKVTLRKTVIVETPIAVHANFNTSPDDLSEVKNAVSVDSRVTYVTDKDGGKAVRLNGASSTVEYAFNTELGSNEEITAFFDFKKNTLTDAGYALYGSAFMNISIGADSFTVGVVTDKKSEVIASGSGVGINNLDWHRIAVTFSGVTGETVVYLDNKEIKRSTGYTGASMKVVNRELGFGSPFGNSFQGTLDNLVFLRGALTSSSITSGDYFIDSTNTPTPPPSTLVTPTLTFTSNQTAVTVGQSATLTWNANDAVSCEGANGWTGIKATSGTQSVSPTTNTTYSMTCTGAGGSVTKSITVTVSAAPVVAAPTISLTASSLSITSGQRSTLTWNVSGATSCAASGAWTGSKSNSGSDSVMPSVTSTYTLTCVGSGGSTNKSIEIAVTPVVTTPTPVPPTTDPAPTVTINATPSTILRKSSATLTWSATNATTCTASGDWRGTRGLSGTEKVSPTKSLASYTLVCSGSGGMATSTATVAVVNRLSSLLNSTDNLAAVATNMTDTMFILKHLRVQLVAIQDYLFGE